MSAQAEGMIESPVLQQNLNLVKSVPPKLWPVFLKIVLQFVFISAVLLIAAGTFRWFRAWIYIGVGFFCFLVNAAVIRNRNPQLIIERHRKHKDTEHFDKVLTALIALLTVAMYVVAGLDAVRYGWSALPSILLYAGVLLEASGMAIIGWAMAVNPYLEKSVRIQIDREQKVVSRGPYALVRHPMYVGMILMGLGFPMIVGSAWSLVPLSIYSALFVLRTALEDETLRRKLPGYEAYASLVRFRLVPGLW
jgi:protein-S-isoprenylcysteine O-methyltransferase Ste14